MGCVSEPSAGVAPRGFGPVGPAVQTRGGAGDVGGFDFQRFLGSGVSGQVDWGRVGAVVRSGEGRVAPPACLCQRWRLGR